MNVLATAVDGRDVIPLWGSLYSVRSEPCGGQNAEITWALRDISERLSGRGIWVMDRGFDRGRLFKEFLALKRRFVIRLQGNRRLRFRQALALASKIRVPMRFAAEVVTIKNGRRRVKNVEYGGVEVRLPFSEARLRLVKFRFRRGIQTFLILTNVELEVSGKGLLWVVKAYLSRFLYRRGESLRQAELQVGGHSSSQLQWASEHGGLGHGVCQFRERYIGASVCA